MVVKHIPEVEVIVVFESHAAEDDDVDFRLHGDSGEEFVVGFARDGEDREFLRFDERVEQVDHRNARADHLPGNDSFRGVDGGAADFDHVGGDFRAHVAGGSGSVEDAAEKIGRG